MKIMVQEFINRYGVKGFFELLIFPIIVIFATPFRFVQALWNSRILLNGKWGQYNRFCPHRAVNSLFYWTQALNIDRFGKNGISHLVADGDFKLSSWFHLTLFSIYGYWRFGGAVAPIVGLFGWLFSHMLWFSHVEVSIVLIVLLVVMLSSTFYANMFEMQNYNALGWMFFPIGIYGLYTDNHLISALGWFLVSLGSFTAFFIAGFLSLVFALYKISFLPVLAIIPAGIKISSHFFPLLKDTSSIVNLLKLIGATKKSVKYKRSFNRFLSIRLVFFLGLYVQFIITLYTTAEKFDVLFISLIILYILNESLIFRFADPQSIHISVMSITTVLVLLYFNPYLLISFLVMLNPPAIFLDFTTKSLVVPPKRKPFKVRDVLDKIYGFLKVEKTRVLFCFDNPEGQYGKIFDGYGPILEAFIYVANKKNIHIFPDWYFVMKYNYPGAPECWGRDVDKVLFNVKRWDVRYIIMYERAGENILSKFSEHFELISSLSYSDLFSEVEDVFTERLFRDQIKFYLLRLKENF